MTALSATPALAQPTTTVQRTIDDRDDDNLLEYGPGEDYTLLPQDTAAPNGYRRPNTASIFNFVQLSDFQTVDEESPGRVEFLDTTQRGPFLNPFAAAYRPQEALSAQFVESMVRQVRNTTSQVTGEPLHLAITTGDSADSQQYNETRWFIDILDGKQTVDPDSGIPGTCDTTPTDPYDGPQGGGKFGYYNPDGSDDGDGYSPDRAKNIADVGRDVTVRDFPGLLEAAQKPFRAVGLGMPWYSTFGNHDALVQGNDPDAYAGPFGPGGETSNPAMQTFVTGCVKPGTLPPGAAADPAAAFAQFFADPAGYTAATDPAVVPRDPRRCYVAKDAPAAAPDPCDTGGWIQQHFITSGTPVGHGFANRPPQAVANHDGYYSFSPRPGLRFLVLDTITDECGSPICSEGSIDNAQYQWIGDQIHEAQAAGQYVIVFSHHTERTTRWPSADPTEQPIHYGERVDRRGGQPQNPGGGATLEELLCSAPNVLAHVNGHEHQNFVEEHRCARDDPPTEGPGDYWEVSTAAHIDWPQQSRMIELFHQDDGTMAMALTMIDHDGAANPGNGVAEPDNVLRLASIGRELAFNDYQAGPDSGNDSRGSRTDRNVIVDLKRPFPCATPCVGQ